ncbi:MAG: hypothetical protein IPM50_05395 [Acidobacteriota bacterium]|nr:MAG: hypothetical protein IPM50_05395 [Acidobacteriota bacterium]
MIAGFNTDIEHNGTTYHVQTEDKGAPANMIMSLVYDRGTILASKRATYEDIVGIETEIAERVQRQHKLICAAIRAGRLEDLKQMTAKAAGRNMPVAEAAPVADQVPEVAVVPAQPFSRPVAEPPPLPIPQPVFDIDMDSVVPLMPLEFIFDEPVIDDVTIIEEPELLTVETVEVVSEFSGRSRPANDKLTIELLGESKFKGGERKTINLMICKGTDRKVVPDAQIMVKVLGSAFRPVIFHSKTDNNGLAKIHLQLPNFQAGRAALLVRATAGGEEVELRKLVTPG